MGVIGDLDPATGALELDTTFKAPGAAQAGVYFGRDHWPHGTAGPVIVSLDVLNVLRAGMPTAC